MGTILKKISPPEGAGSEQNSRGVERHSNPLDDRHRKIGLLWARHFPMRKRLRLSQTVCTTLYLIVRSRALLDAYHEHSDDPQSHSLGQCGVALHEFEELKNELGNGFEPVTGEVRSKLRLSVKRRIQSLRLGGGGGFSGGS
jgi:hypothetical protein